jgi:hypothetical protein
MEKGKCGWFMYTVEYYSAIKIHEILPLATTMSGTGDHCLSKINQTQKDKYHMISLICKI